MYGTGNMLYSLIMDSSASTANGSVADKQRDDIGFLGFCRRPVVSGY